MKMRTTLEEIRLRIATVTKAAIAAACLMAWLSWFAVPGEAATLTVTNTNDSGAGSLRDAINTAAYEGDTINFAPGVSGTITLNSGHLVISKNLTINGPGANVLTISGGMASRIFYVPPSDQLLIHILGLRLTQGYSNESGGAVLIAPSQGPRYSKLTLTECIITGNRSDGLGGGIATFNYGDLALARCTVSDNYGRLGGGGISVSGPATAYLEGCTVSGNSGGYGGGVYDGGSFGAANSTFSGNTGTTLGGAAFAALTTKLTFHSCTLTGNTAPSGGGFHSFPKVTLENSILAGNTATSSPDGFAILDDFSGYNVIGNTSGLSGLKATDQQNVNPLIGPLASNGGPTATHALLPGSPAIDKADPMNPGFIDQRGVSRPMNGRSDIGAYETNTCGGTVVSNLNDSGPGSLRCAISSAFSGGTVTFASGLTGTVTLTTGQLVVAKSVSINGPGPDKLAVSGNNADRVFLITGAGFSTKLSGLKLTGGRTRDTGGGLLAASDFNYSPASLSLSNCVVTRNASIGNFGGGLYVSIGTFNLTDCTVFDNNARSGAGFWSFSTQTTLTNCTVSGNNAIEGGGGVATNGTFSAVNSTFSGNSTGGYGGGINSLYGAKTMELTNCTITGNRSDYAGGLNATTTLRNTLIFNNTVTTQYPDANAYFISLGHNLIGNTAGSGGSFAPSDLLNPNPAAVKLGPLADNGGKTLTHALLTGSIAIDAGDDVVTQAPINLTTDQRGQARLYNAHVDIGAYESQTQPCAIITINPASLPGGSLGVPYNQTLTATGGAPGYSFAVSSGTLPGGLSLSSSGALTGTPMAVGSYSFTITVTDANNCTATIRYTLVISNTCSTITVNPPTLPAGTVGTAYSQTISATGGYAPYTFTVTSGALPQGLSLNATTGALSGTPLQTGTYNFFITVTDGYGCTGSRSYTVTINCPTITLMPATLPAGQAGVAYNQTITATPGSGYTFSVLTGNLPVGLTLNANNGVLSGMPTVTGTYNFTIKAAAANGCYGTQSYSLVINCPAIALSALVTPAVNQTYSQTITATPASSSYSFAVTTGMLPPGLSLNGTTGTVSGTATAAGTYNFTVTATGFGNCTGSRAYSFAISNSTCPTITLPNLPDGKVGTSYSNSIAASPAGTYSYTVTAGSLPTGVALYSAFGLLNGTPTQAGTYSFTIKATDSNGCTGERAYSVVIATAP